MNHKLISFYPGPSRVHDEIPSWVKEAYQEGLLSMNHRSREFIDLSSRTVAELRKKLLVPKSYSVYFISSATECWEIIAQSLIEHSSTHFFNGAFGEKWFNYTQRIKSGAKAIPFSAHGKLSTDVDASSADLICVTQNETSNGTQISNKQIQSIQAKNPSALIAVDATSSMGGIYLNFKAADVWFASVQKCFGLPAGLAVMICSPRAKERMTRIGEGDHYNSLTSINKMSEKGQTPFTPNVLGIYLLMRSLVKMKSIRQVDVQTRKRFEKWWTFIARLKKMQPYISNRSVQSHTVITLAADASVVNATKSAAKKNGILLGDGYGSLKPTTIRIANFPALKEQEILKLMRVLKSVG